MTPFGKGRFFEIVGQKGKPLHLIPVIEIEKFGSDPAKGWSHQGLCELGDLFEKIETPGRIVKRKIKDD